MRAGTITALPVAYLAVDLFYMLSSFVVAFAYEQQLQTGKMSLTAFARVRITRLYPLIFLGTSAGIVLGLFAALKGSITYQQVAFAETWGSFSLYLVHCVIVCPDRNGGARPGPEGMRPFSPWSRDRRVAWVRALICEARTVDRSKRPDCTDGIRRWQCKYGTPALMSARRPWR